jgi:hypothetical protein
MVYTITCNGQFGGGDYKNISSYTLTIGGKNILLDAGTLPPPLANGKYDFDLVFLSHAHLDHVKDFLLNIEKFKGIPIITDITKKELNELFQTIEECEQISALAPSRQLTVEDVIPQPPKTYEFIERLYIFEASDVGIIQQMTHFKDFTFKSMALDHSSYGKDGKRENSYALGITYDNESIIYFGDCTYYLDNEINEINKINGIHEDAEQMRGVNTSITNFIKSYKEHLKCILIECAFPNGTERKDLWGHLRPNLLAELIKDTKLNDDCKVCITHRKPNINVTDKSLSWDLTDHNFIKQELIQLKNLKEIKNPLIFLNKGKSFPPTLDNPNNIEDIIKEHIELDMDNNLLPTYDSESKTYNFTETTTSIMNKCILSAPLLFKGHLFYDNKYKSLVTLLNNGKWWPNLMQVPGTTLWVSNDNVNKVGGARKYKKRRSKKSKKIKKRRSKKSKKRQKKTKKSSRV